MKRIGLTGGIACGKSTVLGDWQQRAGDQLAVIETDRLAHAALKPETASYEEVVKTFSCEIVRADQTIDRARLGEIVFDDSAQLARLNAILHPVVRRQWTAELERLAREGRVAVAVTAIPLLYEVGVESQFDCVVAVGCSAATQMARLAAKGLDAAAAQARIAAQWPVQRKLDLADYVIWNDGVRAALHQQAERVWSAIQEN